jgi:GNAT superfamily N-acetyltransferase
MSAARNAIRAATPADAPRIFELIRALADYEHLLDAVDATQEMITQALFCEHPRLFCDVAEHQGQVVGLAVWFYNFSTFRGRHGIYLEDLFVEPQYRGQGFGKALLHRLAQRCITEGLVRLEWSVLDWNEPSIAFYKGLGAELMDEWTICRVSDQALWRLAGHGPFTGHPEVDTKA